MSTPKAFTPAMAEFSRVMASIMNSPYFYDPIPDDRARETREREREVLSNSSDYCASKDDLSPVERAIFDRAYATLDTSAPGE